IPGEQPVPGGEGELHAVGETDDHDQRGHHVQEHVQAEPQPAKHAERHQNGQKRWRRRNDHERWTPEEDDRDHAADRKTERVVDQSVALDRIADLQLHHWYARALGLQTAAFQIRFHRLTDRPDRRPQFVGRRRRRLECEHHQRKLAVVRQHLALDDLVRRHTLDQCLIVGTFRQRIWKEGRRDRSLFGRLACREYGDQPARAVDQLKLDRELAQLFQRRALQQAIALDDDQHVKFVGGKTPRDFFVGPKLVGVRPEQLAEGVVDLDPYKADGRNHAQDDEDDHTQSAVRQREKADALNAQCQIPRLDRARRDFHIAVGWRNATHWYPVQMAVKNGLSEPKFPLGRARILARYIRKFLGRRGSRAPSALDVVDHHLLEVGGERRAAQRCSLFAVDKDRGGRLLAGARQRNADIGMLALPRPIDDATHHRNVERLDARIALLPLGHRFADESLNLGCQLLEGGRRRAPAAGAGRDQRHKSPQAHRLQQLLPDLDLAGAVAVRLRGERDADG